MLARTRELTEKIRAWYEAFEFHRVYHAVNEFAIVDLSSFYLDVLKDRMYTFAPTSKERRSAQTVLWQITEALTRLVAPILTFTADEVWEHLPAVEGREASVHLAQFRKPEEVSSANPVYVIEEWKLLFALRDAVLHALEQQRQDKIIGKSLEAEVEFHADDIVYDLLRKNGSSLKEFFNVSKVTLLKNLGDLANPPSGIEFPTNIAGLRAFVASATGSKCARCWNFMPHVSNYGVWENVCDRCQAALKEMNIAPPQPEAAA
jgi:isoleucyl-tRNA synthetase